MSSYTSYVITVSREFIEAARLRQQTLSRLEALRDGVHQLEASSDVRHGVQIPRTGRIPVSPAALRQWAGGIEGSLAQGESRLRRARSVAARFSDLTEAAATASEQVRELAGLGVDVDPLERAVGVPRDRGLAEVEAWIATVGSALDAFNERLRRGRAAAAHRKRLVDQAEGLRQRTERFAEKHQHHAVVAEQALGALHVPPRSLGELEEWITKVEPTLADAEARLAEAEVTAEVDHAVIVLEEALARVPPPGREEVAAVPTVADVEAARSMRARLDALAVEDENLRGALQRVVEGISPLSPGLEEEVAAAVERQEKALTSAAVLQTHAEVLAGLGYVVGEDFASMVFRDGHAEIRRPEWGDHWVRLEFDRDSNGLAYRVMGPERPENVAAWCQHGLPELGAALAAAGVPLREAGKPAQEAGEPAAASRPGQTQVRPAPEAHIHRGEGR